MGSIRDMENLKFKEYILDCKIKNLENTVAEVRNDYYKDKIGAISCNNCRHSGIGEIRLGEYSVLCKKFRMWEEDATGDQFCRENRIHWKKRIHFFGLPVFNGGLWLCTFILMLAALIIIAAGYSS